MANEKRLRIPHLRLEVQNNPLGEDDTALTVTHDARLEAISAENHLPLNLDPTEVAGAPETVYATAYSEDAGVGTLTIVRAQDGTVKRQHAQGTLVHHGPTVRDYADRVATGRRDSGNITLANTSGAWTDLDNTNFERSVQAVAGDLIEVRFHAFVQSQSNFVNLDAVSIVSGSPVTSWGAEGAATSPVSMAGGRMGSGSSGPVSALSIMPVSAADIVDGVLTVRMRYVANGGKVIDASTATSPAILTIINHGPEVVYP